MTVQKSNLSSVHNKILGDLNAHSALWGYPSDDARGRHLLAHMSSLHLLVLNDPFCKPTFETTHLRGWPDVSLASFSLFPNIHSWSVDEDLNFADHRLITLEITTTIQTLPKRRYKTKNRSFKAFNKTFTEDLNRNKLNFQEIESDRDFDTAYGIFKNIIIQNCDKHFKKRSSIFQPQIKWWNDSLRKKRNFVKALYRKSRSLSASQQDILKFRMERAKYRKSILEAKRKSWLSFCENTREPYGKTKRVAFQDFHRRELYALSDSTASAYSSQQFYEELTTLIFGVSEEDNIPQPTSKIDTLAPPFLHQELNKAIYSFKRNKAPGTDNIDHLIIRNIYKSHPDLLLNMYNSLLKLNYFPDAWKIGELVYFIKDGKTPSSSSSYRPISLLPIFGKIYEKLIIRRINNIIHNSQSLDSSQHGFTANRSTESAIQEVLSQQKLNEQNGKYTSLISVDFKNAFDMLPWEATLRELGKLKIDRPYLNTTRSFLKRRGAFINWLSDTVHWFKRGCPQGSCFGPFLWRIFLNGLLRRLRKAGIKVVAYADDLLLLITGTSRRQLEGEGEAALKIIGNWAEEHDMPISYEKCLSLTFRKPKYLKRPPTYRIHNKSIKSVDSLPYLGVVLDSTLSFLPHLRIKREEINKVVQNLLKFASTSGSVPKTILKIWYKNILEKKISYAAPCWFPLMQDSHGSRLISAIQAQCLLLISKAYKKTSTAALCVLTGILPLKLQLEKDSKVGRVLRLHIPVDDDLPSVYQTKLKTPIDTSHKFFNLLQEHEPRPPCEIYTDGSKTDEGTAFAFCVFKNGSLFYTQQKKLCTKNSIFQAELLAIEEAIRWADTSQQDSILILSDSLSGLRALEDIDTSNLLITEIHTLLKNTRKQIKFTWVKGHSGILGNDTADRLAYAATNKGTDCPSRFFPYPISHYKRKTNCQALRQWQRHWDTETTGRYTHRLVPKISEKTILFHRNLYLFATNHGPYTTYLTKFKHNLSPNCVCGQRSTSLHYIFNCTLTSTFHIRKPSKMTLSQWFNYVKKNPCLLQKIIECVKVLENNQLIFQNVEPVGLDVEDAEDQIV